MNKVNKRGHMHHFDAEAGASLFQKKGCRYLLGGTVLGD
jgi:hypothetical protein